MCYFCSPTCDNCYPKMLQCPQCGECVSLGAGACPSCGAELTEEMKDEARAAWEQGERFGERRVTRNLVVERMIAEGKWPAAPEAGEAPSANGD